jgi:hypothetical protein
MRKRGGVCRRHCKALFRKHVLPLLYNPTPTLGTWGHVVSRTPVYRDVALPLGDGVKGAVGDWRGVVREFLVLSLPCM